MHTIRYSLFALLLISLSDTIMASDAIFKKPILSRVTPAQLEEIKDSFEVQFAHNDRTLSVLKYGVLPVATVFSVYLMRERIYWLGDNLVGAANWCWSGVKGITGFGSAVAEDTASIVVQKVELVNVPEESKAVLVRLAALLKKSDIDSLPSDLQYLHDINNSFLERLRMSVINKASLCTSLASVLLGVVGKDYISSHVWALVGTQQLEHFVVGSTALLSTKSDIHNRIKILNNSVGRSTIEHSRARMHELGEKLVCDAAHIIAFMQAVDAYSDSAIESMHSQTRMLTDEANSMVELLEYKLGEFEHTADLAKRQELLKAMGQSMVTFIAILQTEIEAFCILADQKAPPTHNGRMRLF